MIETVTLLAYLLGHSVRHAQPLRLEAISSKQDAMQSPQLIWQYVPSNADSLAILVKDKKHYCWVVYNIPITTTRFAMGENQKINLHNTGINSWGQRSYHACFPAEVELFALDQRLSAELLTGKQLEQAAKKHALATAVVHYSAS